MLSGIQRLKLKLLTEGITPTDAAREELLQYGERPMTLAEYATTSGITIRLEDDIWVNAPIQEHNPNFVVNPPNVLDFESGVYTVRSADLTVEAQPIPVPDYYHLKNTSDETYISYAVTHTDRVRVSPIGGCGMVCTFCDLAFKSQYRRKRIDGLIDSVEVALSDKRLPAKHILISGGTPKPEDYDYENTVYRSVAETFPSIPIDIMMVPAPKLLDPRFLYDLGIHGLSVNIEMYNDEIARKIMPSKTRLGIDYYFDFIASAVEIFGEGRVRSLIIVGLEPIEDTLQGVRELAARGCEPVLSPFRPDPATPLRTHPVPSIDVLDRVYIESLEVISRYSIKLGPRCIPCQHNTLTFPDGSEYYFYH